MDRKQKGFTVVEGLLLVIAVTLVVFVGYYVYHSQKNANDILNTAAQTSQNVPALKTAKAKPKATPTPITPTPAPAAPANSGYLVIKEWNLKLKMADNNDVAYTYQKGGQDSLGTQDSAIAFSVKPELLQDKSCKISLAIIRDSSVDSRAQGSYVKVGNYYYQTTGNPYNCGNTHDNNLNAQIRPELDPRNLVAL